MLMGLGFKIKRKWILHAGEGHYHTDGRIRCCWLELGEAAIILQEFPEGRLKETLGIGALPDRDYDRLFES